MPSDYKTNDPGGWCGDRSRGAALGRSSTHTDDKNASIILHYSAVALDSGGYDVNGTYFGDGTRLYWVRTPADWPGDEVDYVERAREDHIEHNIKCDYPKASLVNADPGDRLYYAQHEAFMARDIEDAQTDDDTDAED